MAKPNPFEAPSAKPQSDAQLTPQQLLALPPSARGPLREAFGDRYFYVLAILLGVAVILLPRLAFGFTSGWVLLVGAGLIVAALRGWARERRDAKR